MTPEVAKILADAIKDCGSRLLDVAYASKRPGLRLCEHNHVVGGNRTCTRCDLKAAHGEAPAIRIIAGNRRWGKSAATAMLRSQNERPERRAEAKKTVGEKPSL